MSFSPLVQKRKNHKIGILLCLLLMFATAVQADEVSLQQQIDALQRRVDKIDAEPSPVHDKKVITFGGLLSGVYQHQSLNAPYNVDDGGHGAVVFQPEMGIALTAQDELFAKFGFAAGNGLNGASPFNLAPWAAPLEDDVKDINGRNRDYLLTAWYAHTFQLREERSLKLIGGIIDATDYLDQNAFSNDEHTQFMNEALVNASNTFYPSFDLGGAAVLDFEQFEIAAVGMNIAENTDGSGYNFYGAEVEYRLETSVGNGGYRVIAGYATEAFLDPADLNKESRFSLLFSIDQEFGEYVGAWIRFGYQTDKAKVNYSKLVSGGLDLKGGLWGRQDDNIGIGYAYLNDGNQNLESTQVIEAYYRIAMNEYFALTVDAQYMDDKYIAGNGPSGYVLGARGTVEF